MFSDIATSKPDSYQVTLLPPKYVICIIDIYASSVIMTSHINVSVLILICWASQEKQETLRDT
jgi:hypothetical protein